MKKPYQVKSRLDHLADLYDPPMEGIRRNPAYPKEDVKKDLYKASHNKEDELIQAIDDLKAMRRLAPTISKLLSKKIPLETAIKETSHETFMMLMKMAFTEANPKVKSQVLMHMLSLAGFSATQKHQVERIDPATPRDALLSMIAGAKSDLEAEGIDITDNRDRPEEKMPELVDEDESYET